MATVLRRTDVGVDIRAFGSSWQIAGVSVDNPSGSWLRIPNIGDIPPYVLGWSMPINPKAASIDVLFVASPSGTPSELVGNPVTVTISNMPLPANPGAPSGAVQAQSPVGAALQLATLAGPSANEAGSTTVLVTPGVGKRIIPVQFVASLIANGNPTPEPYFGVISIRVVSGTGVTLLPLIAISPEAPESTKDFPIGTKLAVGDSVNVRGQTFAGGGRTEFGTSLLYYEQIG